MRATSAFLDTAASKAAVDTPPTPFSQVFVTITKQEQIELKLAATQWQGLHRKAVARCAQQEVRHDRLVASKSGLILRFLGWLAISTVLHLIALWYLAPLPYRGGVNTSVPAQPGPLSVLLINPAPKPVTTAPDAATGQPREALRPESVAVTRPDLADAAQAAPQTSHSPNYLASGQLTRQPAPREDVDLNGPEFDKLATEGVFVLRLRIDRFGHVAEVTATTDGDPAKAFLDRLTERFKTVQFSPGEVNGMAVDSEIEIKVVSEPLLSR